jgi:hypothetical protein
VLLLKRVKPHFDDPPFTFCVLSTDFTLHKEGAADYYLEATRVRIVEADLAKVFESLGKRSDAVGQGTMKRFADMQENTAKDLRERIERAQRSRYELRAYAEHVGVYF